MIVEISVEQHNRILRKILRNFRERYPDFSLREAKEILFKGVKEC